MTPTPSKPRHRKFADPILQQTYDNFRRERPDPEAVRGVNAAGNAYAIGFTMPDEPPHLPRRGSRAYAAWAAGVDNARAREAAVS